MYCLWQGKLLLVKDIVCLHALKQVSNQWQLTSAGGISSTGQDGLVYQSVNVVFDSTQGVCKPFIVANHQGATTCEVFECNFNNNQLVRRCTFKCSPSSLSFQILDGPRIVRSDGSVITITNCKSKSATIINLASMFSKTVTINRYWVFNWNDVCSDSVLVMAQLTSPSAPSSSGSTVSSHWASLILSNGQTSQSLNYVPHEYGCIATCISFHESVSVGEVTGDFEIRRKFIVGTSFKQVVVFEEGALLHCVSLDAVPKSIASLENSVEYISLAILCEEETCVAFKLSKMEHKECGHWRDTSDVLVGDFAGIGHDQILMLKHNDKMEIEKFIATDLSLFSTEDSKMELEAVREHESTASLSDTVKAFSLRKHEGDVQLTELESEIQRKFEIVQSSLTFMNSLGQSRQSPAIPTHDPSMLCIVPGELGSSETSFTQTTQLPVVKIEHTWKRVVDGQWIVGLVLKNVSKHSLNNMHCSLLAPSVDIPTTCSSRIIWCESLHSGASTDNSLLSTCQPPAKRKKLQELIGEGHNATDEARLEPGLRWCAITLAPLPNWDKKGVLEGALVVSLKMASENGGEVWVNDIPINLSLVEALGEEVKVQLSCRRLWTGQGFMAASDVNWTQKEHQDLATLLGVLKTSQIEATAQFTSWDRLASILRMRLPLSGPYALKLAQSTTNTANSTTTAWESVSTWTNASGQPESGGLLDGVAVCISPSSQSTAHIGIIYRSEHQLSVVLAILKQLASVDLTLAMP